MVVHTLITYIILSFFVGAYLAYVNMLPVKHKFNVRLGTIIILFSYIFNIIYTGLLGWNTVAASSLEWVLDIVTGIIYCVGLFLTSKVCRG